MTGFGTVETAIEAMKKGAYDYILKPFKVEEVIHIVQRGLDRQRLQHENIRLKDALSIYKISEAIATSLSRREGARPGARRDASTTVDADVVSLLLEDPKHEGHFTERMRKVSERAEPNVEAPGAEPRRGAAAVPRGPPAAGAAAAAPTASSRRRRTISSGGWSASAAIPLKLQPAHHRHAERLQLHARQQVQRGPAQDAVRARPAAPRCRSRTRACTRTSSTRTRI